MQFIHFFNLQVFPESCPMTGTGNSAANKTDMEPAFMKPISYCTQFLPK